MGPPERQREPRPPARRGILPAPWAESGRRRGETVKSLVDVPRCAEHSAALQALAELCEASEAAGLALPSLRVETPARGRTDFVVQLGGVPPETAARLAAVLRAGAAAAEESAESGTVSHLWAPAVGDLVHDVEADRVGEFRGPDDAGRWLLAPPAGGEPWPVDPSGVRVANPSDRVRAEAARATARNRAARVG